MKRKTDKVLFILHLPPPIHGSSVVGMTIRDSVRINSLFNSCFINLSTSKNIAEIGKNWFAKLFRYFVIVKKVLKELIFFKPNLCYMAITVQGAAFYKDAFIVLLIKAFRVPLIYHFHNKGVHLRQHNKLDNLLYNFTFRNSKVILLSKYLSYDIEKYYSEEQIYYCANGIFKSEFVKIPEKTDNGKVKLLFLSNMIESKGVFILMEACKILKQRNVDFICNYVGGLGDISLNEFNIKVKEYDLVGRVSYKGKKYGIEKDKELISSDVFVFPTYYDKECFPLVLLEAMQYSLPIVSTYEGGIPEIVDDDKTGFLIVQKDIESLANKLEILILDPALRNRMGIAGNDKYLKRYTISIFEEKLTSILQSVL